MSHDSERLLGQIDSKLDQALYSLNRHIDDDVRRFTDVYRKIEGHAEDINKAKGARTAALALAGAAATVISLAVAAAGKLF